MSSHRAARAICLAALVAAPGPPALGVAIAATGGCSLAISTDGLSSGAPDGGASAPPDASMLDEGGAADGGAADGDARVDADADAHAHFPADATTWPGNGHAYAIYVAPQGLSWTEARTRAAMAGGHLATLGSSEEDDFVKTLVTARSDAFSQDAIGPWLGGWQPSPTAMDEPAGGWLWIDGTPWTFTDWAPSQPDNSGSGESYLDFYRPGGILGWNDDGENGTGGIVISYVVEFE